MPDGFRHVAFGDVDAARKAVGASVAAVIVEPIQGEGGVIPAPDGYLRELRAICDAAGALLIVDEIQTGLGRTGQWFGFQHDSVGRDGVVPDVVTLAKALGNGMPVGACWARAEIAGVFEPGDHGSTYSATPIATAAVNAVLAELRRIDAPAPRGAVLTGRRARRCRRWHGAGGLLLAAELDGSLRRRCQGRARPRTRRQCRHADALRLRRRSQSSSEIDSRRILARSSRSSPHDPSARHRRFDAGAIRTMLDSPRPVADLGAPLAGRGAR